MRGILLSVKDKQNFGVIAKPKAFHYWILVEEYTVSYNIPYERPSLEMTKICLYGSV